MVQIYHGILLNNKKEQTVDMCHSLNHSAEDNGEQNLKKKCTPNIAQYMIPSFHLCNISEIIHFRNGGHSSGCPRLETGSWGQEGNGCGIKGHTCVFMILKLLSPLTGGGCTDQDT